MNLKDVDQNKNVMRFYGVTKGYIYDFYFKHLNSRI